MLEIAGVNVGVDEVALPGPYSWYLAKVDCKVVVGKLAVDGTGDGVHDRKSANDLTPRKCCAVVTNPPGESGTPKSPDDC